MAQTEFRLNVNYINESISLQPALVEIPQSLGNHRGRKSLAKWVNPGFCKSIDDIAFLEGILLKAALWYLTVGL